MVVLKMNWAPPSRDIEYALAHELLGRGGLSLAILEELVGQPRRWSELKPLLDGKGDENLRKALQSLRGKGLVKPGVDLHSTQKVYALSNLGRLTILKIHEMLPTHQSIAAFQRGEAARASG